MKNFLQMGYKYPCRKFFCILLQIIIKKYSILIQNITIILFIKYYNMNKISSCEYKFIKWIIMPSEMVKLYVDIIFFENLVINYIILYLTKRFSKYKTTYLKLFLGALVGALYIILFFLPISHVLYSIIAKITLSFLIVEIAFLPRTFKEFVRLLGIFYMISFIIGGAAFALLYMLDLNTKIIIYALVLSIILLYANWGYIVNKSKQDNLMHILRIEVLNEFSEIKAFLDTGNTLCDPLSNHPVVIVEFEAIKNMLPEGIKKLCNEGKTNDFTELSRVLEDENWLNRFRLIPFMSLGKQNGILLGFKPDKVIIDNDKREKKDVIVGIYEKKLDKYGYYSALIGPELLN